MDHLIYKTTNTINGRFYIGKHKLGQNNDSTYLGSGTILKHAMRKYGRHNFVRETLAIIDDNVSDVNVAETMWIDKHIDEDLCYNIAPGGTGGNTRKNHTAAQKASYARNMSIVTSGKNSFWYGKKRPDISAKLLGRKLGPRSDHAKQNQKDSLAKNPKSYNKKPIIMDLIYYPSVVDAARHSDYSAKQIRIRLAKKEITAIRYATLIEIQHYFGKT